MDYSKQGAKQRRRRQSSQSTRMRNKVSLLMLRVTLAAVLIGAFGLLGAGFGLFAGIIGNAPELQIGHISLGYYSSFIINAHTGEEMVSLHRGINREIVTLDEIPLHVQNAFIAIEDERFWEHNGIDVRAIGRAAQTIVVTAGDRTEGASTITQQLIKNMLGRFDADIITKLQEQYLAINLERNLTEQRGGDRIAAKEFILESYLNMINLGRSNYGVQAAARFYYNVDVWDLTIAQAATIAAITQNPSRFPPDIRPEANWERAQLVLRNMYQRLGLITTEEFEEAMQTMEYELSDGRIIEIGLVYNSIVRTEGGNTRPIISHFDCFTDALLVDVRNDLSRELGITLDMADNMIFTGGLRIYSTQNLEKQAVVDRAFLNDALWPARDFTIDIEYSMTIYNPITNQSRSYGIERTGFTNMAAVEAYIENFKNERVHATEDVVNEMLLTTPQPQAAFVLLDHHTGHVLALRGVRGEKAQNRTFNRATQATRSPGSQMKPIATFAPGFDLGIMQPATVIDDVPFTHGTWSPGNWWGSQFEGLSTARRAIYRSMNVVSVRATMAPEIDSVGLGTMFNYLLNFGLTTLVERDDRGFTDIGGATTLGGLTHGVRLIELAGAYGSIANMGELNRPVLYTRVLDHQGNVILENAHNPERILRDTTAYLLIDTMRDTMRMPEATGGAINFRDTNMRRDIPVMGKTGTSQDNQDLGFSGSTPYFTASIWLGNDSHQRMHRDTRSEHSVVWRTIMEEIHYGLPPRQFPRPAGIVSVQICRDSGHLPGEFCQTDPRGNRLRNDIFAAQHRPNQTCAVHQRFTYCTLHNYLAGPNCPPDYVSTRVGIVRPIPIAHPTANVRDRHHGFPPGVLEGITCPHCRPIHQFGFPQQPGNQPNQGDLDFWGNWSFQQPEDPWDPFGGLNTQQQQPQTNDDWNPVATPSPVFDLGPYAETIQPALGL